MTRPKPSKVAPHPFAADPDVPADSRGHQVCRCGLIGEPGDPHHTMPERPPEADARELAAGDA